MPRLQRAPSASLLVGAILASQCLLGAGCSHPDLTQYQPAGHRGSKSGAEQPAKVLTSTPAATEIVDENPVVSLSKAPGARASFPDDDLSASALVPVNVFDGANVRALLSVPSTEIGGATTSSTIEPAAANASAPLASVEVRRVELLVKERKFRIEQKLQALRVSFDDLDLLKVLNMEPVVDNAEELMPEWLKGLNGKRICIRGFMYPTYDTEGIEQFVLARDNQICCFGRDPKIYDLIQVDMKPGKSTNYIPATRSFDVVGTFHIKMLSDGGKQYGLYVIDHAEVIDR